MVDMPGGGPGSADAVKEKAKNRTRSAVNRARGNKQSGGGAGDGGATKSTPHPYTGTPYQKFNFLVLVQKENEDKWKEVGGFQSVSGIEVEVEPETHEEGGHPGKPHQLPGNINYPDLTLERGLTDNQYFLEWMGHVQQDWTMTASHEDKKNVHPYRNVRVRLQSELVYKQNNSTKKRGHWVFSFVKAHPVKWSGPDLDAGASGDVAVEEVTLTHRGMSAKRPDQGQG